MRKRLQKEDSMNNVNLSNLSRRRFIAAAGFGAATAVFAPHLLFAQKSGIVPTMINEAARAKIKVHPLRRNVSVLEGSGGNIAVLTGNDGKLLIDSGFTVSRARIAAALHDLSSAPITRLINTHWHIDHTDGNAWVHSAGATVFRPQLVLKAGAIPFRLRQPAPFLQPCLMRNTMSITTTPGSL